MKEEIEEIDVDGINEQEMFEHFKFVVDKGQSTVRIDKFISTRIENTSRSNWLLTQNM